MKTNFTTFLKKIITSLLVFSIVFSFTTATGYAGQESGWNNGKKVNYVPSSGDLFYQPSSLFLSDSINKIQS